ncbi:MAG: iron-containing redox enzyme family protein [Terriglobia bacterium]
MIALHQVFETARGLFDFSVQERALLEKLNVEDRLASLTKSRQGLQEFALAFQFVRRDFPVHNFIVGSRCTPHEAYWRGLATNLWEELGAGVGPTHNELFRRFFRSTGLREEPEFQEPSFAIDYNRAWAAHARKAPLLEALSAIGIFESYDEPDYGMFLRALERGSGRNCDLTFFQVHANAHHTDFFDCLAEHEARAALETAASAAAVFVAETQERLWCALLAHLERGRS